MNAGLGMAPRLFIEEWMRTIPNLNQKGLAERMKTTPGTITKKLSKPHTIDVEWLERFQIALGLDDVTELFRHPDQGGDKDKTLAAILRFWPDITAARRDILLQNARAFAESDFGKPPKL